MGLIALKFGQRACLLFGLDAFGDGGELLLFAQPDGGGDDLARFVGRVQPSNERSILISENGNCASCTSDE